MRRLQVNLTDSTLSTLKKWAAKSGKSASETSRELIESGLEARAIKESVPVSGLPPEAVMDVNKAVGHGIPPEALRFLVADVVRTGALLRQISCEVFSPGDYKNMRNDTEVRSKKRTESSKP